MCVSACVSLWILHLVTLWFSCIIWCNSCKWIRFPLTCGIDFQYFSFRCKFQGHSLHTNPPLTHSGRETHIFASKLAIIGSDDIFIWENVFDMFVRKLVAIWSWSQCVNDAIIITWARSYLCVPISSNCCIIFNWSNNYKWNLSFHLPYESLI